MRLHDFKCPEGHITEELVQSGVSHIRCKCGQQADRIISPIRFQLPGHDDGYPTAHDRWVREHEKAGNNNTP